MEAYIRIGNESVIAPDYIVNELILKGTHQSFDSLITNEKKSDYSFTLLEATYRERTGNRFEPSDYVSFGLADKDGFLTNAGKLLTDQHTVYNSRLFCTRWNGLEKGSIFDDALDDKEYEGNLIYLLKSGSEDSAPSAVSEQILALCTKPKSKKEPINRKRRHSP